jgi:hypothetical protein
VAVLDNLSGFEFEDVVKEVESKERAKQQLQGLYIGYAGEHGNDKIREAGYTRTDVDYSELDNRN